MPSLRILNRNPRFAPNSRKKSGHSATRVGRALPSTTQTPHTPARSSNKRFWNRGGHEPQGTAPAASDAPLTNSRSRPKPSPANATALGGLRCAVHAVARVHFARGLLTKPICCCQHTPEVDDWSSTCLAQPPRQIHARPIFSHERQTCGPRVLLRWK